MHKPQAMPQAKITFDQTEHDFGKVKEGTLANLRVHLYQYGQSSAGPGQCTAIMRMHNP
jgi:hypothetical protein